MNDQGLKEVLAWAYQQFGLVVHEHQQKMLTS